MRKNLENIKEYCKYLKLIKHHFEPEDIEFLEECGLLEHVV